MVLPIGFKVLVSRNLAIQTTGLLTFALAGLSPAEHASLDWTHNQTCSFSSYWNKAYKELANINKLKREKTQRFFRAKICPSLLLLGCILIGKALGAATCRILVGLLGGAGVGLLLMALCILFISGENDY